MRDDNGAFVRRAHRATMRARPGVVEVEAVDHHRRVEPDVDATAPEPKHLRHVRVAKEQTAGELVVLLVERAAGDEDQNGHLGHLGTLWHLRTLRTLDLGHPGTLGTENTLAIRVTILSEPAHVRQPADGRSSVTSVSEDDG